MTNVLRLAVVSAAASFVVALQAQPVAPSTPQSSDITLIGCLMPTDTGMHGPATTGASSPGERGALAKPTSGYVLKDASIVTKSDTGETRTEGAAALEYRLMPASDSVKLDDHLRHQVQVSGQLVNPQQADDPKQGLTPDRADTAHTLKVTGVRVLADQCGAA